MELLRPADIWEASRILARLDGYGLQQNSLRPRIESNGSQGYDLYRGKKTGPVEETPRKSKGGRSEQTKDYGRRYGNDKGERRIRAVKA